MGPQFVTYLVRPWNKIVLPPPLKQAQKTERYAPSSVMVFAGGSDYVWSALAVQNAKHVAAILLAESVGSSLSSRITKLCYAPVVM